MGRKFSEAERLLGQKTAAERLGPSGCSKRASIAANARWAKRDAVERRGKPPPEVPVEYVLACFGRLLDEYAERPGWVDQRRHLDELIAWVKSVTRDRI